MRSWLISAPADFESTLSIHSIQNRRASLSFSAASTDITKVTTLEGKLFLCVVLDLYSKFVIGWSVHHRQDRQMVIRAVEMAIWQRQGDWSVIPRSDRGSQFTSADYQRILARNTLVCSMSAVGH